MNSKQYYETVDVSELPEVGVPVFGNLVWMSGKKVQAAIKRVDEDDCLWRTVDDNSEIDHSLNVVSWLRPVDLSELIREVAGKAWVAGFKKLESMRASNKPSDDNEPDKETYINNLLNTTNEQ